MPTSLVEQLRPQQLNAFILPARILDLFRDGLRGNYLFYGPPGCGKTSLARVLLKSTVPNARLFLNASSDARIDVLRGTITAHCQKLALDDEGNRAVKIIVLDEVDSTGVDKFMEALRPLIEEYSEVRFLATCNNVTRVHDAIVSRLQPIPFLPQNQQERDFLFGESVNYLTALLTASQISTTPELTEQLVKRYFPDLRSALKLLESLRQRKVQALTSEILSGAHQSAQNVSQELAGQLLQSQLTAPQLYTFIHQHYQQEPLRLLLDLGEPLYQYLAQEHPEKYAQRLGELLVTLARYQGTVAQALDPLVQAHACAWEHHRLLTQP